MEPQRYQKIKEIAATLIELDASRREPLLAELCGGDRELRREVESLLGASDDAGDFLVTPAYAVTETQTAMEEPPREQIGPYRIVRQVGAGGMGVVYEAVREGEIQKRVALKVVKPGWTRRSS